MINGVSTNKSERDDIEVQRKWTKLVFLPGKHRRNLQTGAGDATTQAKTKQSNWELKSFKCYSSFQDKDGVEEKLIESVSQMSKLMKSSVDRSYEEDRNIVK